jgi:hypothetical protein
MSEFNEHLRGNETDLIRNWFVQNGRATADITCQRIEWLI